MMFDAEQGLPSTIRKKQQETEMVRPETKRFLSFVMEIQVKAIVLSWYENLCNCMQI